MATLMDAYQSAVIGAQTIEENKLKLAGLRQQQADAAKAKADWSAAFADQPTLATSSQPTTPTQAAQAPGTTPQAPLTAGAPMSPMAGAAAPAPAMAQGILPGESGGMPTGTKQATVPGTAIPTLAESSVPTESTVQTPVQQFQTAAQDYAANDKEMQALQKKIAIGQKLQRNPDNYKAGQDMVNDAYNQLEKISKLKQENSKLITDNLTQTGGILNSIDSQGALDRAKMTFTSMGHTFPDTIPGPNGQPISTKIFTPELQSTFKNQAQSYMSTKDQLEFKDKAERLTLDQAKEKREAEFKVAEEKRKDSEEARKQQLLPAEIKEKEALAAKYAAEAKAGGKAGGRAQQQMDRIVLSGEQAVKDLSNLSRLNDSVSTAGFKSGQKGILAATKDAMVNKVSKRDYQIYDAAFAGLSRNLAVIESVGAASGLVGLSEQMAKLAIQPNDKIETVYTKLAQARQIVDTGLDFAIDKGTLTPEQEIKVKQYKNQLQNQIPFTVSDILDLQDAPKGVSLADLKAKKAGGPAVKGNDYSNLWTGTTGRGG